MAEEPETIESFEGSVTILWTRETAAEGFSVADRTYYARAGDVMEVPEGVAQVLQTAGYVVRTEHKERELAEDQEELKGAEETAEASAEELEGGRGRRASPPVRTDL